MKVSLCYTWEFTFLSLSLNSECSEDINAVVFICAISVIISLPYIKKTGRQVDRKAMCDRIY